MAEQVGFTPYLVRKTEDKLSHNEVHMINFIAVFCVLLIDCQFMKGLKVNHSVLSVFDLLVIIKFPFKRKACHVYEGGCCRQVSTVVFLVVW